MAKAELHLAYGWTCDHCGQYNFERSVRVENPELQQLPDGIDLDGIEGEWAMMPATVKCGDCGEEYETETDG